MRHSIRPTSLLFLTSIWLGACSSSPAGPGPTSTYELLSVGGNQLPVGYPVVGGTFSMISSMLTLSESTHKVLRVDTNRTQVGSAVTTQSSSYGGNYLQVGDSVRVELDSSTVNSVFFAGEVTFGRLWPDSLILVPASGGGRRVYSRVR